MLVAVCTLKSKQLIIFIIIIIIINRIDCTEAQFCHIGVMITVFIFGTDVWSYTVC